MYGMLPTYPAAVCPGLSTVEPPKSASFATNAQRGATLKPDAIFVSAITDVRQTVELKLHFFTGTKCSPARIGAPEFAAGVPAPRSLANNGGENEHDDGDAGDAEGDDGDEGDDAGDGGDDGTVDEAFNDSDEDSERLTGPRWIALLVALPAVMLDPVPQPSVVSVFGFRLFGFFSATPLDFSNDHDDSDSDWESWRDPLGLRWKSSTLSGLTSRCRIPRSWHS
ncbi:unnamed protein product [Closterium sp. Yama58-4]|nr:unnamed protein product [Closterium sp. Yama58-4]